MSRGSHRTVTGSRHRRPGQGRGTKPLEVDAVGVVLAESRDGEQQQVELS